MIVGITLLGIFAGGGVSVLTKPTYTSETQLFVAIQNSGSVQELQQGNTFSQARVQSYVRTVESPIVLQPVIDALGLDVTADELAENVTASTDLNTVLINISAADSSPVRAAAIAQSVADSLVAAVDKLEKPKTGGASPISLSITKPAVAPTSPSAPHTNLNLVLGLLTGLMLGVGTAVLKTTLDSRIRGEADLRRVTNVPLLGAISFAQDAVHNPLITREEHRSPRAESFRQLRTNLQFANVSGRAKTILVTSSLPGEGKSTTATNLAIAIAQSGQSVCLIDADLRRPMVNEYLGLDRNVGLTTALVGDVSVNDVLQSWGEDDLFILTSGRIPPNPSELLGSATMNDIIKQLEMTFDTVIVDAPPLLPVTDAAVLSQHVGGVLIVVGTQKVKQQDLEKSLTALEMVEAEVLGVVLNRLPMKGPDAYSYGYYTSDEASTPQVRRGKSRTTKSGTTAERPGWPQESSPEHSAVGTGPREARAFPRQNNR